MLLTGNALNFSENPVPSLHIPKLYYKERGCCYGDYLSTYK